MRQNILIFLAILSLFSIPTLGATFGITANGKLDQPTLSKAYKESDWDKVTQVLESYLKRKGDSKLELQERIFAYKYLGTIYAADSLTHTKSESYYNRLLDLAPSIEIFDLFASKKINDFFEEVKRDHERSRTYANKFDSYGQEQNPSQIRPTAKDSLKSPDHKQPQPIPTRQDASINDKRSNSWLWWTVGSVAVTGAAIGVYYMSQNQSTTMVISN